MIKFMAGIICIAVLVIAFFKVKQDLSWLIEYIISKLLYRSYKKHTMQKDYIASSLDTIYEFINDNYFYVYHEELYNDIDLAILSPTRLIIGDKYHLITFKEWRELCEHIAKVFSMSPNLDLLNSTYQYNSYTLIASLCKKLNMNISIDLEFSMTKKDDGITYFTVDNEIFSVLMVSPTLLVYIKYIIDNDIRYLLKSTKTEIMDYVLETLKKLHETDDITIPIIPTISGSVEKVLLKIIDTI